MKEHHEQRIRKAREEAKLLAARRKQARRVASLRIQTAWRCHNAYYAYKKQLHAAARVQRWFRSRVALQAARAERACAKATLIAKVHAAGVIARSYLLYKAKRTRRLSCK